MRDAPGHTGMGMSSSNLKRMVIGCPAVRTTGFRAKKCNLIESRMMKDLAPTVSMRAETLVKKWWGVPMDCWPVYRLTYRDKESDLIQAWHGGTPGAPMR
jgi:hypothetical protein